MADEIKCDACGNMTQMGRMLCLHCGEKLHTSSADKKKAAKAGSARARKANPLAWFFGLLVKAVFKGVASAVALVVRLVVFALVIGLCGLVVWPVNLDADAGGEEEVLKSRAKLGSLILAEKKNEAGKEVFSEAELNGYLSALVEENRAGGGGDQLQGMEAEILESEIVLNVKTLAGPIPMSMTLNFYPKVGNKEFDAEVLRARIGHMPMLGPGKKFVQDKIKVIFSELKEEREVLEGLESITLSDGALKVIN